jgi:signal transduction histidine kinase
MRAGEGENGAMSVSRVSLGATVVWALSTVAAVASVLLIALSWDRSLTDDLFGRTGGLAFMLLALAFATVGAMIFSRVPGNPVGWIFIANGALTAVGLFAYEYAAYGLSRPGGAPGTVAAAWASSPVAQPVAALLGLALLLFPDGRPASPRWRIALWVPAASLGSLVVSGAFLPGRFDAPFGALSNPLGITGAHGALLAIASLGWLLAVLGIALGAASAAIRLRRARGDERQQLKLVLTIGSVLAAVAALDMVTWFVWPHGGLQARIAVVGVSFAAFAVAAGVAILRYRLYDMDVAIERTLVYGTLTLLLAAGYVLTALALGTILGSGSTWVTAGATLVVAIAFRPLRRALQDAVDRRFSRARYEALRRIAGFLDELRAGRAAPEEIEPLLRELLADPTLELRLFLPESGTYVNAAGLPVFDSPGDTRTRTPIERSGAPLALVLHRPTGPKRPDPVATLVQASGLAIEIARLRVELRRHLAEVEASRARIVAAGNAERRRIERDLHDGAQQRLVSIGLELRHAQHQLSSASPQLTRDALDRAVLELSEAITELRELAHGLPPSQLDAGLEPALNELAGRAPLPVEIRTTPERYNSGLEAAAYFIACESLTNAIKHARATAVVVSARRQNGHLVVSVADDGIGGAHSHAGSGLSGLRDRVAAQGGSLRVDSEPDVGTTITAELPCGS